MITLKVKDDDWLAAKDHWVALKAQLTDKASIAKADFIDDVIFNTTSTTLTTATTITTEIDLPSVSVMTELINEIDNETKMDESNTNMNQLESSEEIKLDENVKKFVCDAVKSHQLYRIDPCTRNPKWQLTLRYEFCGFFLCVCIFLRYFSV